MRKQQQLLLLLQPYKVKQTVETLIIYLLSFFVFHSLCVCAYVYMYTMCLIYCRQLRNKINYLYSRFAFVE